MSQLFPGGALLLGRAAGRGLASSGDRSRLRRVVHRLLTGQPVRVLEIGGSITLTQGATPWTDGYTPRFNSWIEQTFPHADHRLRFVGFGGGTSAIYAVCAHHVARSDDDLITLEFAV